MDSIVLQLSALAVVIAFVIYVAVADARISKHRAREDREFERYDDE